jgi:hypothetical protein
MTNRDDPCDDHARRYLFMRHGMRGCIASLLVCLAPPGALGLKIPLRPPNGLEHSAMSRRAVGGVFAAALMLPTTKPALAELYTSYGKKELASYDALLLEKASEEISSMIEGTSGEKRSELEECKRLISLVLKLDWQQIAEATKKRDQSLGTTQKLNAAIKKEDPKVASRAILELAEDLDVAEYVSPINEQFLGDQDRSRKNSLDAAKARGF